MQKYRTLQRTLGDIARAVELHRSHVFDADLYRQTNPDVPEPGFAATLQFCRHGRLEQRVWNQPALGQWLIPHVLDGSAHAADVRCLIHQLAGISEDDLAARRPIIEAFCARHALNFSEYQFHESLHAQDYKTAYACLANMPMTLAFLPYYRFARRHMKMDQLGSAFACIREALGKGADMGIEHLIAARDIAAALGYPDTDRVAFHQLLLKALANWPAPNKQARFRAMWQMGFPLIPGDTEAVAEILAALPEELRGLLDPADVLVPESVQGYEAILNLVTLNGLKQDQRAIPCEGSFSDCVVVEDALPATCRLRVLGEGYWRQADHDPIQESFLDAFKAASRRAANQVSYFYPVAATNIFDVRQSGSPSMPTLSYHSIALREQRFLNFKESALPGYFRFDRLGFSGWEERHPLATGADISSERIDAAFKALRHEYVDKRVSKYEQRMVDEDALPDRFLLAALQVPDDTVMSLASMDMDDWLDTLVRACEAAGTNLVIKSHPLDKSATTRARVSRLQDRGSHVFVSQTAIHHLLERAEGVVTVNSGVGVEALLHLKPVITVGASDYSAVAHQVSSRSELMSAVEKVTNGKPDADWIGRVKLFLYQYCHQRSFSLSHFPDAFDELLASLMRGA
ncbi:hypothetical protein [Hyphomonas atlantica]|nr:hypothetical protein [Hyphomonas atlantica]